MSVDRGKLNEFASGSECRTERLSARIDGRLVYRWAHMGFNFIHFFRSPAITPITSVNTKQQMAVECASSFAHERE